MSPSGAVADASTPASSDRPPSPRSFAVLVVLFGVVYFAGAELGHVLSVRPIEYVTLWPPAGLFLAALLLTAPPRWPALILATLPATLASEWLLHDTSVLVCLAFFAANTLATVLAAWIVRSRCGGPPRFDTLRSVIVLTFAVAFVSLPAGATAGAAILRLAYGTSYGVSWLTWYTSDLVGDLVVTPLLLTVAARAGAPLGLRGPRAGVRILEGLALVLGLVAVTHALFGSLMLAPAVLTYPFLLWATLRFGLRGVVLALALMAFVAIGDTVYGDGLGPFIAASPMRRIASVQIYISVSSLMFLALAAVLEDLRRTDAALRDTNASLEDRIRARTDELGRSSAELRRHADRQEALLDLTRAILAGHVRDGSAAPADQIFARAAVLLDADVGLNYRMEEDGHLRLLTSAGVPAELLPQIERIGVGQGLCGSAAAAGEALIADAARIATDPQGGAARAAGVRAFVCHPLRGAEGRTLGTLSFASTRRDRFEPDEIAFLQTVCHFVALAWERAGVEAALREGDRRKDEFLATLAHELRNPLAPMRNAAQLLRLKGPLDPMIETARDMIERQVNHQVRLVDDLLDVSRITRGKITLRRELVALREAVELALETSRPHLDAARHRLELSLPAEPLHVQGDLTRLSQVLANLLNNAARYTPEGGRVALSVAAEGSQAALRVSDSGIGIPPEVLPRIFDMFMQADRSLERAQGGLGIGLTLVKRLVELHGGAVEAGSAGRGQGSTFTVRLPLVRVAQGEHAAAAAPGSAPGPRGPDRVLVVDDNVDSADSLALLLEHLGHVVRVAYDGPSALKEAGDFAPALVLLDIGLPGMSGYEVARQLRTMAACREAVLVAQTGWGQDKDRQLSKEAGFDHHLVKPVEFAGLQKLLGELRTA
jgi:signal transduction histidine kinase/integral membrane sensor domain MASE1/CheY-like chemotaxis protein